MSVRERRRFRRQLVVLGVVHVAGGVCAHGTRVQMSASRTCVPRLLATTMPGCSERDRHRESVAFVVGHICLAGAATLWERALVGRDDDG